MDSHIINTLRQYFSAQPVEKAWIFGSFARGEQTDASDVDILVRFIPGQRVGLFKHASMIDELQSLLRRTVDLVADNTLLPWVEPSVARDKTLIYEREAS